MENLDKSQNWKWFGTYYSGDVRKGGRGDAHNDMVKQCKIKSSV